MANVIREADRLKLEENMKDLPRYVKKYFNHKLSKGSSPSSLLGYARYYREFFGWLMSDSVIKVSSIGNIELEDLEKLFIDDIDTFINFLRDKKNKDNTISTKLSGLKSLFNYLQNKAENSKREPLLTRNVMAKVDFENIQMGVNSKAEMMYSKILQTRDEIADFRYFVLEGFSKMQGMTTKQVSFHQKNCERDAAIVSLILGSGIRVSEVVSLNLDDVDMKQQNIHVFRKGNKESVISFSDKAKEDLLRYLEVREYRYKPAKNEKAVFLAQHNKNDGKRIDKTTVQAMIKKYTRAFGRPNVSVHNLRHTFGTHLYAYENDLKAVQEQLGHEDPKTSSIYALVGNRKLKDAVNEMDK